LLGALALVAIGTAALTLWPLGTGAAIPPGMVGNPDRGAYLARMAGCIGCHTDSDNDGAPLAGGVPLDTPFGTFHSPNITPDPTHGIGAWRIEQFEAALRHGLTPTGASYFPAFPFPFYAVLSDQDVADLWAAFQTVPPVAEPSLPHDLTPPFNLRLGLKLWRALYFHPRGRQPDPTRSDAWNRGRWIVEGPAHCGACHTPRTMFGGRDPDRRFAGAGDLPGGAKAPSIVTADLVEADWKPADLTFALRMGLTPDGDSLGGPMGEVVRHSTSWLSDGDLDAIATYLLDTD
jgi:mono/diheme cytochrome c family protein